MATTHKTSIGRKQNRITLQTQPEPDDREADSHGQLADKWTNGNTYWAEVKPLSGRALVNAQQTRHDATHQITTRYTGSIDPALNRWKWGSRIFNIISALNTEERRRETVFICVERLSE